MIISRQPENPHDPNAIQVLVPAFNSSPDNPLSVIWTELFNEALPDDSPVPKGQWNQAQLYQDPFMVGYISAKTGHAALISEWLDGCDYESYNCTLISDARGNPAIVFHHNDTELAEALAKLEV